MDVQNRGAGTLTITPTTSTVDGASSLALTTGQGRRIASDGTNYFTQRGIGGGGTFTGGTLTSALNEAPTVTIASASTMIIGAAAANTIAVSGTATINAFDTIAAGAIRRLRFQGIALLMYNATSMILPTSANISTAAGDVATFESLGSGNWRCINYTKFDGAALSSGSGLLTSWTESVNNASPNATTPVVRFLATNAATDVDAAISPKGNGGVAAQVADGTTTGGNKRGTKAVDWQQSRTGVSMVASGNFSTIGGGQSNIASTTNCAVAGGSTNTASASAATVGGGSSNSAQSTNSTVCGGGSNTINTGLSYSTIAGGTGNLISVNGLYAAIGGGNTNTASGQAAAIAGGDNNTASGLNSAVFGGQYGTTRGLTGS
jgi:hypothetical protein